MTKEQNFNTKEEFAITDIGELLVERNGEQPVLLHAGTHHHMGTCFICVS
jgi:hypothetical protein